MKKIVVGIMSIAFMISCASYSFAADKKKTFTRTTTTTFSAAQNEAIANAAVETLNSQVWTVYLVPSRATRGAAETDLITFSGTSMSARNLADKGYAAANFIPVVQEDNSVQLDAVQRMGEDKLAMWRVMLVGDYIQGVLTMRTVNGPVSTYTFSSNMPQASYTKTTGSETKKK